MISWENQSFNQLKRNLLDQESDGPYQNIIRTKTWGYQNILQVMHKTNQKTIVNISC